MKHSPYSQFDVDRMNYRDFLAMDRTTLANERTLLAYGRTSLMVLATGVTAIKLFGGSPPMVLLGQMLIPIGAALFLFGAYRYWRIRKAIYSALDRIAGGPSRPPSQGPAGPD